MMLSPLARQKIQEMLLDDVGFGDLASKGVSKKIKACIFAKSGGILAGTEEAQYAFTLVGADARILKQDGSKLRGGERIIIVRGRAADVFSAERVALNLLMWMSGIATTTAQMVELAKQTHPGVIIASTRKTILPIFDKKAVEIGGGDPHRLRLDDCMLLKSNQIKILGGIEKALKLSKCSFTKKIEVEAETPREAVEAARLGADIVMLDNFSVEDVRKTVQMLEREGLRDKIILEISGGVNPSNVREYAELKPDVISSSYMTMRPSPVDFSLEVL